MQSWLPRARPTPPLPARDRPNAPSDACRTWRARHQKSQPFPRLNHLPQRARDRFENLRAPTRSNAPWLNPTATPRASAAPILETRNPWWRMSQWNPTTPQCAQAPTAKLCPQVLQALVHRQDPRAWPLQSRACWPTAPQAIHQLHNACAPTPRQEKQTARPSTK